MSRAFISTFAATLAFLGQVSAAKGDLPWRVSVTVEPRFPEAQSSEVHVTLLNPAPDSCRMSRVAPMTYEVRPRYRDERRPSHLVLLVRAVGFEPLRLNTGLLSYQPRNGEEYAVISLPSNFSSASVPYIANIVKGSVSTDQGDATAFDITMFNPKDSPLTLTRINLYASRSAGSCYDPVAERYRVRLDVSGNTVLGSAQRLGDTFSRRIRGRAIEQCGTQLEMGIPLNVRLSPNDQTTVRFEMVANQAIGLDLFQDWHFTLELRLLQGRMTLTETYYPD